MGEIRPHPPSPADEVLLFVYELAQWVGLILLSPYLLFRVATRERYRKGLAERLSIRRPPARGAARRIWIHGASAGEMTAVAALVHAIQESRPDLQVVVSSATTSGVEVARRRLAGNIRFLLPLDLFLPVRRVVAAVDADVIVLVELELWPRLLAECARRGTAIMVANGRMELRSSRRYARRIVRRVVGLDRVARFAVQNQIYADRIVGLGIAPERVVVTGNLKLDVPDHGSSSRDELRATLAIAGEDRILLAGSTHPGEEERLARAFCTVRREETARIRLIVAPRHAERLADAERNLQNAGLDPVRLTRFRREPDRNRDWTVLVVDTMGELADLYGAADVAIVGGSLIDGIGGHNVFEPALQGTTTLVGPHHRNVRSDVLFLESIGAIEVVADEPALVRAIQNRLSRDDDGREAIRAELRQARGAARRTTEILEEWCSSDTRESIGPGRAGATSTR